MVYIVYSVQEEKVLGQENGQGDIPALASNLAGTPQARTSAVSGVGLTYMKLTPSGKESPALSSDMV
jgi:hypothetical protein